MAMGILPMPLKSFHADVLEFACYTSLMIGALAYAEVQDTSGNSSITLILLCLLIIAAAAGAAVAPIALARQRRHRQRDVIVVAAIFWAMLAAGSICYFTMAQMKWKQEYLVRIESGYGDPQDRSGAPAAPVGLWAALAVVYVGIILWAISQRNISPVIENDGIEDDRHEPARDDDAAGSTTGSAMGKPPKDDLP